MSYPILFEGETPDMGQKGAAALKGAMYEVAEMAIN